MARFSLSFAGLSFEEHGYAPVQHVLPTLATRIGKSKDQNVINKSSAVVELKPKLDGKKKRKDGSHGLTSLPLLVLPDGNILADSWEISKWACTQGGLETSPEKLCKVLDEEVGTGTSTITKTFT